MNLWQKVRLWSHRYTFPYLLSVLDDLRMMVWIFQTRPQHMNFSDTAQSQDSQLFFEHGFLDTASAQCQRVAAVLSISDYLRMMVWIFQTRQQHSPRSRSQWMGRLRSAERHPIPNPNAPWRCHTRSTDSSATCWSSTCVDRKRRIWMVRGWLIVNALGLHCVLFMFVYFARDCNSD